MDEEEKYALFSYLSLILGNVADGIWLSASAFVFAALFGALCLISAALRRFKSYHSRRLEKLEDEM